MNESGGRRAWLAVPVRRRNAIVDRKQRRSSPMMKRMLFSMAILVAVSTMVLLGSTPDVKAGEPVVIADVEDEIHYTEWSGDWYKPDTGSGGDAKLFLKIVGKYVDAEFSIYSFQAGQFSYRAQGTAEGSTMDLERRGRTRITLRLSRENGRLVLKGEYDVISGRYEGEQGTFTFKKL